MPVQCLGPHSMCSCGWVLYRGHSEIMSLIMKHLEPDTKQGPRENSCEWAAVPLNMDALVCTCRMKCFLTVDLQSVARSLCMVLQFCSIMMHFQFNIIVMKIKSVICFRKCLVISRRLKTKLRPIDATLTT